MSQVKRRQWETWQQKKDRNKRWLKKAWARLIEELGGKCAECGSTERLEFDHLKPRTWAHTKVNQHVRLARLKREAAEGLIQLLCKSCNCRKGAPVSDPELDANGEPIDPLTLGPLPDSTNEPAPF